MIAARALRYARKRAGLTQRQLAEKTGVPQSTIGRIESGAVDPRVKTLSRLIRACRFDLEVEPLIGEGVDRTLIRWMLEKSPQQRFDMIAPGSRWMELLGSAKRISTWTRRIIPIGIPAYHLALLPLLAADLSKPQ